MSAMAAGVPDDVDTYRRHATELIRYATVLVGPDDAPDVVTDAVLAAFARTAVAGRREPAGLPRIGRCSPAACRTVVRPPGAGGGRTSSPCARPPASRPPTRRSTPTAPSPRSARSSAPSIYLTYWEDQSPAQIADLLDVSEGAVRKQLARARDHLRRILDA